MYNDESNGRQSQSQSQGFVRRPIPNSKYGGGADKPSYQSGGQGYSNNYGGGSGGYRQDGGGQSSYSRPQRRGQDGGSNYGGSNYSGGGGGGYRSGGSYGYNRNNSYGGGQNDRVIRQNDIMIKLLKEIRDRLPAPPGMETSSDSYGSDSSYSNGSYSGGSYSNGSYAAGEDAEATFEAAGRGVEQSAQVDDAAATDSYGEEDDYNS